MFSYEIEEMNQIQQLMGTLGHLEKRVLGVSDTLGLSSVESGRNPARQTKVVLEIFAFCVPH